MLGPSPLDKRKTCLLVLGMHRSGTSALSGTLAALGALRPKREMPPHRTNSKGFFEPTAIVEIHDRLLAELGSSWRDWRPLPSNWKDSQSYRKAWEELVAAAREDFDGPGTFLLKDPRICRLVDLWLDVAGSLQADIVTLQIYREPAEVAASLGLRDDLDQASSLLLWLQHVLDAELATRGVPRVFVSYAGLLADRPAELALAFKTLKLNLPPPSTEMIAEADAFLDPELRHQVQSPDVLPAKLGQWVDSVFSGLERLRNDPHDQAAMRTFDDVRAQLTAACELFGPVFSILNDKSVRLERNVAKLAPFEAERNVLLQSLKTVAWAADRVPALTEAAGEAAHLRSKLMTTQKKLAREVHASEAAAKRIEALQSELAQVEEQLRKAMPFEQQAQALEIDVVTLQQKLAAATALYERIPQLESTLAEQAHKYSALDEAHRDLTAKLQASEELAERVPQLEETLAQAEVVMRANARLLESRMALLRYLCSSRTREPEPTGSV